MKGRPAVCAKQPPTTMPPRLSMLCASSAAAAIAMLFEMYAIYLIAKDTWGS